MFIFDWFFIQAKILKNSFKENKKEFLFRDILHLLLISLGLVLLYIFLNVMFNFIGRKNLPVFDFAFVFLSFTLLLFLPLVFYSAIILVISFLFQKEEIQFYLSLPVNRLSIFSIKFIQIYFHTTWMVFLGLITFLAALQTYFKINPWIYLTASIGFLTLLLIPVSLAVILVIIISRFIPFVRAKGVLTVIGLLIGSILVTLIRLMQPEQVATNEGKMRLVNFMQNLHRPWMTIFPSEWTTSAIFAQARGDLNGVIVNFISLIILAAALVILTYILAKFFYRRIWEDSAVMSVAASKKFSWQVLLSIFPSTLRVFIRKDLLTFYRDTVEKGSLLVLIPLCFVYLFSIHTLNRSLQKSGADQIFSFLYIYLFNFFYSSVVVAALSGRWVFPSVSLEGNNFKLIKTSVTSLKDFLRAKFLLGFIPLFLLGEVLVVSSCLMLRIQLPFILVSAFTTAILCYGLVLICLTWGIKEADFSIRAPLDFALGLKGFLCLIREFIFVVIMIILVGIPVNLFLEKGISQAFTYAWLISAILICIILAVLKHNYRLSLILLSQREI